MDLGLQGKTALVCAASKGLGRAVAESLAHEGVRLFVCSRDMATLSATVDDLNRIAAHPVQFRTADLSSAAEREVLIAAVQSTFGGQLDILVHNTGGPPPKLAVDSQMGDWQDAFDYLFQSVVQLNTAFLPGMRTRRWGRIVTITSLAAVEPIPNLALSSAMRAAITGYTKAISNEVAADGVTLNTVAPGLISTDRLNHVDGATDPASKALAIPAKRFGLPSEIGDTVAFLCSQQAAYITGSVLCVDGGKRRATA